MITYAIVVAAFAVVTAMNFAGMLSNSLRGQLVPICTYVMMAVSLNLTVGILGELSLGHAGFMSVGAFSAMCFSVCMEDVLVMPVRFALALLIGGIAAGIAGFLIGIPVLRLQGDYLAIVTLAFGEIIKNVLNTTYPVSYTHLGAGAGKAGKIPGRRERNGQPSQGHVHCRPAQGAHCRF